MKWWQITIAFADTAKTSVDQSPPAVNEWLGPSFVGGIVGALIGAVASFLAIWYSKRQRDKERQKAWASDEKRYIDWIINEYRFLKIADLRTQVPREVELKGIYVSFAIARQTLTQIGLEDKKKPPRPGSEDHSLLVGRKDRERISIGEALNWIDYERIFGLVILGGHDTDKTTVLKYIARTYACRLHGERFNQPRPLLPFLINLCDINAKNPKAIAEYMTDTCNITGCKVCPDFFDMKLERKECIILLDGLDKIADEMDRWQVARWIERQCNVYSGNPFVVTCKRPSFRNEYLPPRFLRLDIRNFYNPSLR